MIEKFKRPWTIVGLLAALLVFKTCQGCSNSRKLNYEQTKNSHIIDSLTNKIDSYKDTVKTLRLTNKALMEKNGLIQDNLESIKLTNSIIKSIKNNK